jgi:hypothetical protein
MEFSPSSELNTALSEISWGIKSWELLKSLGDEARFKINLLEEDSIALIGLSERLGWTVYSTSTISHTIVKLISNQASNGGKRES